MQGGCLFFLSDKARHVSWMGFFLFIYHFYIELDNWIEDRTNIHEDNDVLFPTSTWSTMESNDHRWLEERPEILAGLTLVLHRHVGNYS